MLHLAGSRSSYRKKIVSRMMRSVPRRVEPEVREPVQLGQYQAERLATSSLRAIALPRSAGSIWA
jgi:hypothetical protein